MQTLSYVITYLCACACCYPLLYTTQQRGYQLSGIAVALYGKLGITYLVTATLCISISMLATPAWSMPLALVFACYALLARQVKVKYTKRMVRLVLCNCIVCALCLHILPPHITFIFFPAHLALALVLIYPIEFCIARYYICKAQDKLRTHNVTVIGITGSYGKTSVKHILQTLLPNSICTPLSYNTPMGIAKFINQTQLNCRYLILEMGARHRGDIGKLCRLFHPKHGIVTGLSTCHIATLGSLINIAKAKGELLSSLSEDSIAVVEEKCADLLCKHANKTRCITVGRHNCDYTIRIEKCSAEKSVFCIVGRQQAIMLTSPLIGVHSTQNTAIAVAMSLELGTPVQYIVNQVKNLVPIQHRQSISKTDRYTIIDDSYNANIEGVKALCNTLELFPAPRCVITQGIVEQGKYAYEINFEAGKSLGEVCDYAFCIGQNSKALYDGLHQSSIVKGNIFIVSNVKEAVAHTNALMPNGVIAFQNDIPPSL